MSSRTRYKGRFIKDKVLAQKEKCRKGLAIKRKEQLNLQNDEARNFIYKERRIVDRKVLGKNLKCQKCQELIFLENMTNESRKGLHSISVIEYKKCLTVTHVHTGKYHSVNEEAKRFLRDQQHNDVTTDAVLGKRIVIFYKSGYFKKYSSI